MNLFNAFGGKRRPPARHGTTRRVRNSWRGSSQLYVESLDERLLLSYDFTLIAQTGAPGSFNRFVANPTLNDYGTVIYPASLRSGGQGVFTGDGGPFSILAVTSELWRAVSFSPQPNNLGTGVFVAQMWSGGQVLLSGDGGPLTWIADTDKGDISSFIMAGQNNDQGTVAFAANLDMGGQEIRAWDGKTFTTLADTNSSLSRILSRPSLNAQGAVAFRAELAKTASEAIVRVSDGELRVIADTNGPFSSFNTAAPMNNAGTVVSVANLRDGGQAFLRGDGKSVTVLVDTSGPFNSFTGRAINDWEQVAFRAELDTGIVGIFGGLDPDADQVIAIGSPLFGSTVTTLGFQGGSALNNAGQIVFVADLADGRQVIVRADPTRGGGGAPGGPVGGGLQAAPDVVSLLTSDPAERRHVLAEIAAVPNGVANEIALVIPGGTEAAAWLRPTAPVLPDSPDSELVDGIFDDFAAATWLR